MGQIWDVLRIEPTTDKRAIKKAYACRAKEIHPEENPEEFRVIYEAYQGALRYASLKGKRMTLGRGQRAPQEAFPGEGTKEKQMPFEGNREQEPQPVNRRDEYERLGLDSEAAKREWARLKEIEYFRSWWKNRLIVWANNEAVRDEEWKSYLLSEDFRGIMWSPIVLEDLVYGLRKHCLQKEEVLLFFWDLYDWENMKQIRDAGAGLRLYKVLYPAYTNRMKRQQYEENREEIKKGERRRIWRLAISVAGVIILAVVLLPVLLYFERMEEGFGKLLAGYLLGGGVIFIVWLFWHFVIWG